MENLISPYGGSLKSLMLDTDAARRLRAESMQIPTVTIEGSQLCDLELLLSGAYSPLSGFLDRSEIASVERDMRLPDGTFWPSPVTLHAGAAEASDLKPGMRVALRDQEGFMLAVLDISDAWRLPPGKKQGNAPASERVGLAGRVTGVSLPTRHDFSALRLPPDELRNQFLRRGWRQVIAYHARGHLTRAQYEFALRAAIRLQANLLLHPLAGGDPVHNPDYVTRVRTFQAALPRFPSATTLLALLPLIPDDTSPREILLRAIVARNCGCSHLIVGGTHETGGTVRRGGDVFDSEEFRHPGARVETLGVELIPFPRMVYVEDRAQFLPEEEAPAGLRKLQISGEEVERRLAEGLKLPDWYTFPEVLAELLRARPARDQGGFTVFFTGLSGSGKSTLARALTTRLLEMGGRQVTLLDGDIVRRNLSSELGFSREHRDLNVRRIGYVASEITKHRGIAICAPIAPYAVTRRDVRSMISRHGGFIEVHVSTPLEVCEGRDRKGLYAKARAGLIPGFTGVSDPYEMPEHAELGIDTTDLSVDEGVQQILLKLEEEGYLR